MKMTPQPNKSKQTENGNPTLSNSLHLSSALYAGPLPPAEAFEKYERVLHGASDRILKMAEEEANHRRKLETCTLTHNIWIAHLSQIFAFILGITGLIGGVYCVSIGQAWAGVTIGGASLVALVSAFLIRK